MPPNNKPGINYSEVRNRFETGESVRSISRDLGISHTALNKRIRKEGWKPGCAEYWEKLASQTERAIALREPKGPKDIQINAYGKRTPENAGLILAALDRGQTLTTAMGSAGVKKDLWAAWLKDDPEFAELVSIARHRFLGGTETDVGASSRRGDIKASLAILKGAKETREDWIGAEDHSLRGAVINVKFNWGRGEPGEGGDPVIDVTPKKE